jgi:hypothetical protein
MQSSSDWNCGSLSGDIELFFSLVYSLTMKMEEVRSSERSVDFYQTTRSQIPEYSLHALCLYVRRLQWAPQHSHCEPSAANVCTARTTQPHHAFRAINMSPGSSN